jgi:hypothetical protein
VVGDASSKEDPSDRPGISMLRLREGEYFRLLQQIFLLLPYEFTAMGYHHIAKPIYTPSVGQGNDKAVPERDRQDRRHILLTRAPSDMLETRKHPRRFTASRHATGLSIHLFK